ncbi:nuclear transport factor 2 family protein [Fimbriimonas ginsengisoli]|uniref:DUF4440 domain-containing protein n=1 Tax=Fimbriimonas ginsengisoli Gsoil 348 TaxID=661478 RepID=A0A068NSJ5_FIMGI|nr:nuclear transport factor 2 family protein [Fimbriimonas ginsengisoli]AIE86332.1 hypothetical protein OP10G_2964 [Fimbriimonas ginsengisoli Gsoil 348]
MKNQRIFTVIALVAVAACASAEDAKKAMQGMAAAFDKAVMAKDLSWFEKTAAPDYHEIGLNGSHMDRKGSIDTMKQMFQMMTVKSIKSKIVSVKQTGNTIKAVCDTKMSGEMMAPKAKKPMVMKSSMRYQELWKKEGGAWKIHELKSITENTTIDGKKVKGGM